MNLEQILKKEVTNALKALYRMESEVCNIQFQKTKKEFEGDITLVVFPFTKLSRKSPENTGEEIGAFLQQHLPILSKFNVIKGFLNLTIDSNYWIERLNEFEGVQSDTSAHSPLMMIEYSSPNTNKPLHLGHIRNNLLGHSIAEIQKANNWQVVKTNIVNDRGIHICKSMLAWQKFGNGETPLSTGMKGDHLVGKYYVAFDKAYKAEIADLQDKGYSEEDAKREAPIMQEAQAMLRKWEQGDPSTLSLWREMNGWVYEGFETTYKALGVDFDKIYYESDTYKEGKSKVEEGLDKGLFFRKEDGSVWADLSDEGLDEKLLLRGDGTSVYMTQDIGTAKLRFEDYPIDKMVYVVGNEQIYHFQVLSILLDKLGFSWGKDLVHFSYGMVELPDGKMKSREGTVVDADDLIAEMVHTAQSISEELGKLENYTESEKQEVSRMVGLGALKYFILKVDPRKNMIFDPSESIDFNGNTGPFIQYTHARIQSVLRKAKEQGLVCPTSVECDLPIADKERQLVQLLLSYPDIVREAGKEFSPAIVANYTYELVKEYNQFYHDFSILKEEQEKLVGFRLMLSAKVAHVIKHSMGLLGIDVPDRM